MKVRVRAVPKQVPQNDLSFTRTQNKTNDPFNYRKPTVKEEINVSYPEEKKGEGNTIAEKGEYIAKPDGRLFKINGKSHKEGGTDINMEPGDFIFSNKYSLTGDILKTEFNLNPKKSYTFAEIASKYKDSNKFFKLKDHFLPLEKKTGERMLNTYKEKLAKLALLQETQKGLPQGIPTLMENLLDVASSTSKPESLPVMAKGGEKVYADKGYDFKPYQGDKTNKKNAAKTSADDWAKLADELGLKDKVTTNEQLQQALYDNPEFKPIIDKIHQKGNKGPTNSGKIVDGDLGYRWDDIHTEIRNYLSKKNTQASPATTPPATTPSPATDDFKNIHPDATGNIKSVSQKDLGYSSPEKLALLHELQPIPNFGPTRQQNYGLEQSLSMLASSVMPYDYTSVKNEASRAASLGVKMNRGFQATPQAMATNALIAGQLATKRSDIEGQEYNANAALYNQNAQAQAQLIGAIGQDKEQQAAIYDNAIVQGKENRWGNMRARNRAFVTEYANAKNNRSLRNAYSFLGESTNPNFQITNADNAVGFTAMANPFDFLNQFNTSPKDNNFKSSYKAFKDGLPTEVTSSSNELEILKLFIDFNKTSKKS